MGNKGAFQGLARLYARHRPSYPEPLLLRLKTAIDRSATEQADNRVVVDIGSGSGISTRLIRRYLGPRYEIIGIEPNPAMIQQAVADTSPELNIKYISGDAEHQPLASACAVGMVAAQAVQWFERVVFYREAARVLMAGGTLAIMQNNRCWQQSEFLEKYESFIERHNPEYSRDYRAFDIRAELATLPCFEVEAPGIWRWTREMTINEFVGMSLSSTKVNAIVRRLGEKRVIGIVTELAERYVDDSGVLQIPYQSELYVAHLTDHLLPTNIIK
jgi:SAM-dependent methyltransferase